MNLGGLNLAPDLNRLQFVLWPIWFVAVIFMRLADFAERFYSLVYL